MKAVILNSGNGKRMGTLTSNKPKCLLDVGNDEAILGRQLCRFFDAGINEFVITTGMFEEQIIRYCRRLRLPLDITYIKNPLYNTTNYIYSLFCAKEHIYNHDIILVHGDLVWEDTVLSLLLDTKGSGMIVSSTAPLSKKDFKAQVIDNKIVKVGVDFFDRALAAQPFYKLEAQDWSMWFDNIELFCRRGKITCYAEDAFNEISAECCIMPLDIKRLFCGEVDTPEDLALAREKLNWLDATRGMSN